jgi:ATP-dependent protease ClpP protease subunit
MPDLIKLHNLAEALKERAAEFPPPGNSRPQKCWFNITNLGVVNGTSTTSVRIDGFIGDWGVTASDFMSQVNSIKSGAIDVHFNSEGGEVYDALAIYEGLMQHPATITSYVDSLAASAASIIMLAGDTVKVAKNARIMVHDAAMGGISCFGTAADIRSGAQAAIELADMIDDMSNNIASIYAEKTGGTVSEWRAKMQAGEANIGTWFSAQQAIDMKLADSIIGDEPDPATNKANVPATKVVANTSQGNRSDEVNEEVSIDVGALLAKLQEVFS